LSKLISKAKKNVSNVFGPFWSHSKCY
jgi:hypothetical protein